MAVGDREGLFPKSIDRRITELLAYVNNGAAGFTIVGDRAVVSAGGSISPVVDSNGIFTRISTSTVKAVSGDQQYNRQKEPVFHTRFKISSTSSIQIFLGLTNQSAISMPASSLPSGHYAGLYIPSGSSTFRFVHSGGGTITTNTQKAIDTGYHNFYMWFKRSGGDNQVLMQIDDSDRYTATGSIPNTTQLLRYALGVRGISVTRSLDISKCTINQEA